MPRCNRPRRERTHDWQKSQQYTLWPEQRLYEKLRPVVRFNESSAERARETSAAARTLQRKADFIEVPVQERATGVENTSSFLRLVVAPRETEQV